MGEMNLNSASASSATFTDYSVPSASTDGIRGDSETEWVMQNWTTYLGYFKEIPELAAAINAKATWTIGKGFKADETTTMLLDTIKGWGKDTFNTILENMIRTYYIGGDSFAEIVRDDEGILINLKPLDPSTIKVIANKKGIITRYEQMSKTKGKPKVFQPEQIFHLARNRLADEVHGESICKNLEWIILARNEAMEGYKSVMQKFMKPRYIFHLDTDDETKIATFKTKMDQTWADGNNIYIPKDAVVPEQMSVSPNSTLNPQAWIESLNNYFYEACGTPKIIVGGANEFTEATAKIVYLAFQQNVEEEQLFIEEELLAQMNIVIELTFPVSLENEMLSDNKKDGDMSSQPNETTAGSGQ